MADPNPVAWLPRPSSLSVLIPNCYYVSGTLHTWVLRLQYLESTRTIPIFNIFSISGSALFTTPHTDNECDGPCQPHRHQPKQDNDIHGVLPPWCAALLLLTLRRWVGDLGLALEKDDWKSECLSHYFLAMTESETREANGLLQCIQYPPRVISRKEVWFPCIHLKNNSLLFLSFLRNVNLLHVSHAKPEKGNWRERPNSHTSKLPYVLFFSFR